MLNSKRKKINTDTEYNIYEHIFNKCRICLKPGQIAIFGENHILSNVVEFGSITINEKDKFPKYLCQACYLLLKAAVLFRQTATKTDKLLRTTKPEKYSCNTVSPDTKYLEEINQILEIMQPVSEDSVSGDSQSEYKFSQEDLHMDSLENDGYSSSDDEKTDKEYLVVNESDTENNNYLENLKKFSQNQDVYMVIVADNVDQGVLFTEDNFTCDVCSLNFKTIGKLENHVELEHNIKINVKVSCPVCNEVISKVIYKTHMKSHRQKYKQKKKKRNTKIECKICKKNVNKTYFNYHFKMHGNEVEKAERTRECIICNKFISLSYYNDHLKRQHKVGPCGEKVENNLESKNKTYKQCPVCDKKITQSQYKIHVAQHEKPVKKIVCEYCAKEFVHPSTFKTHCLTHRGEMKYSCQFCPYKAQHLGLLKVHVRTHTDDYNYKCTECPARFITKSNLNQHLLRHNGPGEIKCFECDRMFYRQRNMEEHYNTKHLGIKDVKCNICGKGFSHRDRMLSHQLKVHKREKLLPRIPTYLKIANEENMEKSTND